MPQNHGLGLEISAVIPVYNSEAILPEVMRRLSAVLEKIGPYEVIFVNDGSADKSWEQISSLKKKYPQIVGINLSRNYGQHNALLCGIIKSRGKVIVTLDDDLQNPPEEIPKLLGAINDSVDIVYGKPAQEEHGFFRDLASRSVKLAFKFVIGMRFGPDISAFRAFRGSLREPLATFRSPHVSIDILLSWESTSIVSVVVEHRQRETGESGYSFWKLLQHAKNMLVGYSLLPLRLASIMGFTFMIVGVLLLTVSLVNYLVRGSSVPGFTFLASAVSLFSGVQLFCLGIMGEYLGVIYSRSINKPPFVIRTQI